MSRLTQEDFLQTPCPSTSSRSRSRILEAFGEEEHEPLDFGRSRLSVYAPPRRPPPKLQGPRLNDQQLGEIADALQPQQHSKRPRGSVAPKRRVDGAPKRPSMLETYRERRNARHVEVQASHREEQEQSQEQCQEQKQQMQDITQIQSRPIAQPKRTALRETKLGDNVSRNLTGINAPGKENLPPGKRNDGNTNGNVKRAFGVQKDANGKISVKLSNMEKNKPPAKQERAKPSRKRSSGQLDKDAEPVARAKKRTSGPDANSGKLRLIKRTKRDSNDSVLSTGETTLDEESLILPSNLPAPKPVYNRIITSDYGNPAMYESWWLSAQESSIAQLLNALFTSNTPDRTRYDPFGLRQDMLKMYGSAPFPLLHRRLQASLHIGALAPAKDTLTKSSIAPNTVINTGKGTKGWGEDLGLRQKFTSLFIDTYETDLLATALEVVVGREVFMPGAAYSSSSNSKKKTVEAYLTKFIVCCEDALNAPPPVKQSYGGGRGLPKRHDNPDDEDWGTAGWLWRKSILRSLMIILLLDKAKANGVIKSRLFQRNSAHKTSNSVLHELARLLLPSLGDIARPLAHLNYTTSVVQHPLEEYDYAIDNLATDLRDGVRLVRVIELLLYSSDSSATSTSIWPLSQHLKYPAIGRAQKVYNVSLALHALQQVGANKGGVTAADIVDGYRERSVGLLLEIMQKWGLGSLVEWDELRREIRRLDRKLGRKDATIEYVDRQEEFAEERLLKQWAQRVAEMRGLRVENLTSSFADGAVFAAIVEEYERYFPRKSVQGEGLEAKLASLGCNSYFAALFGKHMKNGLILDKDFVVSALAFLSSRLVACSARERAATIIQTAFRAHKFRNDAHRRIRLLVLAHDCAAIVQTKERVTNAAITIQRAYRKHLQSKIEKLIRAVTGIQAAARRRLVEKNFKETQWAAVVIQRHWRKIRDERFYRRIGIAKEAVTSFQAVIRGRLVRERIWTLKAAVMVFEENWQRVSAGLKARRAFLAQKNAVNTISNAWVRYRDTHTQRALFKSALSSVTSLQSHIRGFLARRTFKSTISSLVTAQSQIHTHITRSRFLANRQRITTLQRRFRTLLPLLRARRAEKGIVALQSLWRGCLTRKTAGPRLRVIRQRLDRAAAKGGETLLEKVIRAIGLLRMGGAHASRGLLLVDQCLVARECAETVVREAASLEVLKVVAMGKGAKPGRQILLAVRVLEKCFPGGVGTNTGEAKGLRKVLEGWGGRNGVEWKEVKERLERLLR